MPWIQNLEQITVAIGWIRQVQVSIKTKETYDISRSELSILFATATTLRYASICLEWYDRNLLKNDALQGNCLNMKHGNNIFSCIGFGRLRWCWQPKLPKPRSCQACEFRQSLSSKRMWQGRVLAQKQSSSSQKFTRRWSWQLSGWTHRCIVNQAVVWWCSAVRYTVDSTDLCASKFDMSRASTWNTGRQACEASLRRLKTDYIVPRPFKLSCTSSPWILQNHPSSSKMSLITSNFCSRWCWPSARQPLYAERSIVVCRWCCVDWKLIEAKRGFVSDSLARPICSDLWRYDVQALQWTRGCEDWGNLGKDGAGIIDTAKTFAWIRIISIVRLGLDHDTDACRLSMYSRTFCWNPSRVA